MSTQPLLEVQRLDVRAVYGGPVLGAGVSFTLQPGDRLGLIGRNGAGKSTLLRQMAGLLPLSGDDAAVRWRGADLHHMSAEHLATQRALMPAQTRDRFSLPVIALLELAWRGPDAGALGAALRAVDAWDLRDHDVLTLSAGERQRVALAQALVQDAAVLLLDEPVAFQDPAHQRRVADVLRGCTAQALVFCAHDVNWVAGLATQVLGLGLPASGGEAPGWFLEQGGRALDADRLRDLYGCAWVQLAGADGATAWMPA